jgi:peptide deformylase
MAILKVARLGHPVLRRVADPIPKKEIKSDNIQSLIDDMFETMDEYEGIGLAGPQVHRSIQILVTGDISHPDNDDELIVERSAIINPEITFLTEEETSFYEGCLSVPDLRGKVSRPCRIRLRALDRDGKKIDRELEGFAAIVCQHEVDHLHGVMFIDRMRDMSTLAFLREHERYVGSGEEE